MEIDPLFAIRQVAFPVSPTPPEHISQNREVIQAVSSINSAELFGQDAELTFQLDRETRRPVVRIVNRKTRELIRQVPQEAVLRMAEQLRLGETHL